MDIVYVGTKTRATKVDGWKLVILQPPGTTNATEVEQSSLRAAIVREEDGWQKLQSITDAIQEYQNGPRPSNWQGMLWVQVKPDRAQLLKTEKGVFNGIKSVRSGDPRTVSMQQLENTSVLMHQYADLPCKCDTDDVMIAI